MNIKLDAKAIGGVISALVISLISWLFRSVQQLTNEVAVLKAELTYGNDRLAEVLTIINGLSGEITEIIWKIGG
tara:strand:+ start:475 stop:696 length:222 start_codon:yes stop_codon:yes gene_type:complete